MTVPKILAFAGSARRDSLNKKLARVAVRAAVDAGAQATFIDLDEFTLPVYHGDLEDREGIPQNARKLKKLFCEHQGLIIVSPENNASVSALLKNTIDWISRPDGGQNGLVPFQNKVAALMAATDGNLGGVRGLPHLRQILQALGVLALPGQFTLSRAHEAFDAQGNLLDPKHNASVAGLMRHMVGIMAGLKVK